MMKLIKVDATEFCGVLTAYELEAKWRESGWGKPKGKLKKAEIKSATEVAAGNPNRVFFTYTQEAHALTLQEVANIFTNVERAILGKCGGTRVVCFLPKRKETADKGKQK